MSIQHLLAELRNLDVKLWIEDDKLRYNAPQGVMTRDRLTELAGRKAEIMEWLNSTVQSSRIELPPVQPVARDKALPLSYAQQRLWVVSQFAPDDPNYNMPLAIRMEGRLDHGALVKALNEIIRRHEILRSSFLSIRGQAQQVIDPNPDLDLDMQDLRAVNPALRSQEVDRLQREYAEQPFDLSKGPLLRTRLLQIEDESYVLLITMHHIISDGWSIGVLFGEVGALYNAFKQGLPSPLSDLQIQYADYAAWQRAYLKDAIFDVQLGYWKKNLLNLPVLQLPTDRPRTQVQTSHGATELLHIPKNLSRALGEFSKSEESTMFMTLLAAFAIVLMVK